MRERSTFSAAKDSLTISLHHSNCTDYRLDKISCVTNWYTHVQRGLILKKNHIASPVHNRCNLTLVDSVICIDAVRSLIRYMIKLPVCRCQVNMKWLSYRPATALQHNPTNKLTCVNCQLTHCVTAHQPARSSGDADWVDRLSQLTRSSAVSSITILQCCTQSVWPVIIRLGTMSRSLLELEHFSPTLRVTTTRWYLITLQCESKKPPIVFWNFFPNGW